VKNHYLITERYLGDEITVEQTMEVISILREQGWSVAYGDPENRLLPPDWDFNEAIDFETALLAAVKAL